MSGGGIPENALRGNRVVSYRGVSWLFWFRMLAVFSFCQQLFGCRSIFLLVRVGLAVLVCLLAVSMLLSTTVSVLAACCHLLFSVFDGLFLLFSRPAISLG